MMSQKDERSQILKKVNQSTEEYFWLKRLKIFSLFLWLFFARIIATYMKIDAQRERERERWEEAKEGEISNTFVHTHTHTHTYICIYISSSSSSSCRSTSTGFPDSLSPFVPIIHRFWQVFKTTSCVHSSIYKHTLTPTQRIRDTKRQTDRKTHKHI